VHQVHSSLERGIDFGYFPFVGGSVGRINAGCAWSL
jgi:hypothetical protein